MIINPIGSSSGSLNGIIKAYLVKAGANVNAGDFVQFLMNADTFTINSSSELYGTKYSGKRTISAVALDDSRVFIVYCNNNTDYYLYGMLCTVTDSGITVNDSGYLSKVTRAGYVAKVVALDSTHVFIAHTLDGSEYINGRVFTVIGTSLSGGTDTSIVPVSGAGDKMKVVPLDSTHVLIAYGTSSISGVVCTIADKVITPGTPTVLISSSGGAFDLCSDGATQFFISYNDPSNGRLYGALFAFSGEVINAGEYGPLDSSVSLASSARISSVFVDTSHVFVAYPGNGYLYGAVCQVSDLFLGNRSIQGISYATDAAYEISAARIDKEHVFVAHSRSASGVYYLSGIICALSFLADSTVITPGTDTNVSPTPNSGEVISATSLSREKVFIAYGRGTYYYLYASTVAIENLVSPRSTSTDGVATTSGTGGSTINVCLPK